MVAPWENAHARGVERLAAIEPGFARLVAAHGGPPARRVEPGLAGLARIVVGQQVSVHAARAIWTRLETALGGQVNAPSIAAAGQAQLAAAGLSRQKIRTLCALAAAETERRLDLSALPLDDEEAAAELMCLPGIGRWTAEIFLLFACGRLDVLPAGDLAVRVMAGRLFDLAERPREADVRARARRWSPHRGVAAVLLWHGYNASPL